VRRRATPRTIALAGAVLFLLGGAGCAYFNTLHNARAKFDEAQLVKDRAEPDRTEITKQEETLYTESFEKAARVVKYWPDSKWVDDALLLMGKASFEKGDYSTALRKFDEILTFFPDSDLRSEALVNKARTQVVTRELGAALETIDLASAGESKEWRGDIAYLKGVVSQERAFPEEALASFTEVVEEHEDSPFFADAGMRAGEIAMEAGDPMLAASFYERVRRDARTPEERYRGGMKQGEALIEAGEWKAAEDTFHDVAKASSREDERSVALLERGKAVAASGNEKRARELWTEILEKHPRREGAAGAQLELARLVDETGDLEAAREQYDLVKEQGTGHPAWQEASARIEQIDRVLALREEIASEDEPEPERKRFLLAEQLLEDIGDTEGAMQEYSSLAADEFGTEWGAKALYAQAWVAENRMQRPDSAETLLHRLANYYSGTEVDAFARRRLGYPVWNVEIVEPPRVIYIRPEGEESTPTEIARDLVPPRDVPLPPGVSRVVVWARLHLTDDGTVERVKIVKSGGEEFDAAVREAAEASSFLPPDEGGPAITVLEYRFPPERAAPGEDAAEPSAAERDATLEATDAAAAAAADSLGVLTTEGRGASLPPTPEAIADSLRAAADSARAASRPPSPRLRGRELDSDSPD
jgi:TonB family protein